VGKGAFEHQRGAGYIGCFIARRCPKFPLVSGGEDLAIVARRLYLAPEEEEEDEEPVSLEVTEAHSGRSSWGFRKNLGPFVAHGWGGPASERGIVMNHLVNDA